MDLRNRRRRDRHRIDRHKEFGQRPGILVGQNCLDLLVCKRSDIAPERGELVGVRLGKKVGSGAEQLPELHERRAQVFTDHSKSPGTVLWWDIVPECDPLDRSHNSLEMKRGHDILITVTNQCRQDLSIARKVTEMTDGFSNHEDATFGLATRGTSNGAPRPRLARSRYTTSSSDVPSSDRPGLFILHLSGDSVKLILMIEMKKVDGFGKIFMPIQQKAASIRSLESPEEFFETRLEAIGFIFHGTVTEVKSKSAASRAATNLLHFARCPKLEKVNDSETKIWFRSVRIALNHLDELIGHHRWKWCKVCDREITQRILDEH